MAVTTATQLEALPNVPTVGEFVPGYEAILWQGIGAPKNTRRIVCHSRTLCADFQADLTN